VTDRLENPELLELLEVPFESFYFSWAGFRASGDSLQLP
jgi:hypothetical protein